jgi:2-polyprenyl-3-methyl-5-hydroxy-6-metoxy-1,4-benzoquinol methylase
MSLRYQIGQWLVPPAFHAIIKHSRSKPRKDVNETVTPIQLRHFCRYQFARSHLHGKNVLDAACGAGYGSDLLEPLVEYVGIDYADYCIRYARANYSLPHRRFIEGDLHDLGGILEKRSFDSIVSFETLEHLNDPEKVISILLEFLKPSGRLIMSIPLNHPDLVYHKRQYTHNDVRALMRIFISNGMQRLDEYLQRHLQIAPVTSELPMDATGTWLGVMTVGSPEGSQPADAGDALQRA